ncbi:MAG: putative dienelactone hydrolase [Oleispira sp.]|jgi:predicted dienelactone hydrolase
MKKLIILAVIFISSCGSPDDFKSVLQDLDRNRSINYQIWTPVEGDDKHPLVLLSHGSGGDYTNHNWLIETLVANGYIVAAPNHPSNTTQDNSDSGVMSVWERPADISRLLDHLLKESRWSNLIDENRVGAAGFSSGGYTVLALGGAIYDRELINIYCNSENHGPDCDLGGDDSQVDYSRSSLSYKDERIKSIFAMAPAVGAAITKGSLGDIQVPVFIIASKDDELVYPSHNAARYAEHISTSSLELLPSGGHFIFLECNLVTHIADWFISELDLCGSEFDVDREQLRETVASKAVNFFDESIGNILP